MVLLTDDGAISSGNLSIATGIDYDKMNLYDISALQIDEDDNWLRPDYPRYESELAPAKPFLVPSFDDEVVEILPSVKQNRKINFDEQVYILEIENRFQMMLPEDQVEEEDDVSYEIEIVEGGQTDDADFYLEMIDGEIFYVFETEDDISDEGEADESDSSEESDDQSSCNKVPMQLDIGGMMAPNLNESMISRGSDENMYASDEEDENEVSLEFNTDIDPTKLGVGSAILENEESAATFADSFVRPVPTSISPVIEVSATSQYEDYSSEKQSDDPTDSNIVAVVDPSSPTKPTTSDDGEQFSPNQSMRSILKACQPSPKIESPKKSKKERKASKDGKKKTFSKTYVRADDFDGEHQVYSWEKPSWASSNKLRSTDKGDAILKGANLAQPITDTKELLKNGKFKWTKPDWANEDEEGTNSNDDVNAKEELIRKIQQGELNLPSKHKNGNRLKITLNGSTLREGSDIVKPITKATVIKKPSNVNTEANPKILRATPIGNRLKEGQSIEAPTTQATTLKKYKFEQPSWTQVKLHSTQAGDILKKGGDVALAITPGTATQNKYSTNPDWKSKRGLGRQASASVVDDRRKEFTWAKPTWALENKLRKTPKGDDVRAGKGDLARPITNLPHLKDMTITEGGDEKNNSNNNSSNDLAKTSQRILHRDEAWKDGGDNDEPLNSRLQADDVPSDDVIQDQNDNNNNDITQSPPLGRTASENFERDVKQFRARRTSEDPIISRSKSWD
jgi:hypothetical protein